MRLIDADKLMENAAGLIPYSIDVSNAQYVGGLTAYHELVNLQPTVNEWIPVSERLPEEEKQYLCVIETYRGLYYKICRYAKDLYSVDEYDFLRKKGVGGFYMYDSPYGYVEINDIIAWMPIPEYRGDDNE